MDCVRLQFIKILPKLEQMDMGLIWSTFVHVTRYDMEPNGLLTSGTKG